MFGFLAFLFAVVTVFWLPAIGLTMVFSALAIADAVRDSALKLAQTHEILEQERRKREIATEIHDHRVPRFERTDAD